MSQLKNITLYTDHQTYDVTPYVMSYQIQTTLTTPYESALISLKIPTHLQGAILPFYRDTGAIDLDAWVTVRDSKDTLDLNPRVIFCGRMSAVSYGETVSDEGLVEASNIELNFSSWLAPLMESQIYLSGKSLLDGHIYDIQDYGRLLKRTLSSVFNRDIGGVLRTLYNELSPSYRFPLTLAGGASLSQIPIIHSKSRAATYAPDRAPLYRGVYGLALNAAQIRPTGAPWSILSSFFDVDPSLIELFPTLEPAHARGPISDFMGSTPVIVYRLKPFIFGALRSQSIDPNAPANQEHARNIETLLTADEILEIGVSLNAQDRINSVYVDSPLNESRGIEAFGLVGTPTLERDDIARNGLRMYRGQWPFFPQGAQTKSSSLSREINYTIEIIDRLTRGAHRYMSGTLRTVFRPDLRPGLWLRVQYPQAHRGDLIVYLETITHSVSVDLNGVEIRRSTLNFTRAFFNSEEPHHD